MTLCSTFSFSALRYRRALCFGRKARCKRKLGELPLLLITLSWGACARSRSNASPTSSGTTVQHLVERPAPSAQSEQLLSIADASPNGRCEEAYSNLSADQWVQVAPQSCYHGTERHGPTRLVSVTRSNGSSIELPLALRNECWVLAVARETGESDLHFDLTDSTGEVHPLGNMRGQHALLPAGGLFCSLRGEIHSLTASTSQDVSVVFRIAWHSYSSLHSPHAP